MSTTPQGPNDPSQYPGESPPPQQPYGYGTPYPQGPPQQGGYTQPGGYPQQGYPQQGYPQQRAPVGPAPERPSTMRAVVWLMVVGAVLSVVSIVVGLATVGSVREEVEAELERQGTDATADVVNAAVAVAIGSVVVIGVISVGLWLWMAWKNGQGRSWARVVGTVLGGLNLLFTALSFTGIGGTATSSYGAAELVVNIVSLLVAVVVLVLLWLPASNRFFAEVSAHREAARWGAR